MISLPSVLSTSARHVLRKLKMERPTVKPDSTVVVEGHSVGHMEGLKFVSVEDKANAKPVLTAGRVLPEELPDGPAKLKREQCSLLIGPGDLDGRKRPA